MQKIKFFFKILLYPLRKIITRLVLFDEEVAYWTRGNSPFLSPVPIELAATYICAEDIEGDYLEFGCFRGHSFIKAYKHIHAASKEWSSYTRTALAYTNIESAKEAFGKIKKYKRRFYAFDSFKGLPELKGIDKNHARFSKGRYDCSEKEFIEILFKAGVNLDDVIIVPGYYEKTLNNQLKKDLVLQKAAIIMIDCDLYASTKIVLNFITNLIDNGTIIIFDDWYNYKGNSDMGEQKACKEWLEKTPKLL